ncbi:MAG: hypothetical protein U5L74_07290 [Ideonella sp.]|nr:hypothetical protein [Ideonella sp.]
MDSLGQDTPWVPLEGTLVFALVAAQAPAGQAPFIATAGFAAQQAFLGHGVNVVARIAAVAGPGETLLSAFVLAHLNAAWRGQMEDLGTYYLRHFDEPQQLFKLGAPPLLTLCRTMAAACSATPP